MKKLGVLFATVIMLMLFVVSANALEPTGQCGDNVYWNFNESTGELVISGSGDMWNDISVFRDNNGIKKVTIKKGVTSVSDEAFDRCFYLESVDLADSVTSIGYGAFTNCDGLNSIYIPKSVTEIKTNAFSWSDSLSSIIVDNDNLFFASDANGVLFDKDFKTLIRYPIGNKQTSYTIPKGVVNIARIAFLGCYELISVAIPDTVVTIGEDAFNGFAEAMKNVKKDMEKDIPTDFGNDLNMSIDSADSLVATSSDKPDLNIKNNGIFGKLDSILSLLEYYIPTLQNRQLCLDTGVLVGELTPPINKELAKIEMSKERGR